MKKLMAVTLGLLLSAQFMANADEPTKTIAFELQKESEHACILYTESDSEVVDIMLELIEENYPCIANDLQYELKQKFTIELYPNLTSLHQELNSAPAEEWLVAGNGTNGIAMVSPLNSGSFHSYEGMLRLTKYKLALHIIQELTDQSIPSWLSKGIALYECIEYRTHFNDYIKTFVQENIEVIDALTFEKISRYELGLHSSIGNFVINTFGIERTRNLLKNFSKFEEIMGMNQQEFEALWVEYLKNTYNPAH